MKSRISATEAVRSFSELMNRVRYRGESFLVERGGKLICEIRPAAPAKFSGAELANLLRSLLKPDFDSKPGKGPSGRSGSPRQAGAAGQVRTLQKLHHRGRKEEAGGR